MEMNWPVIGWVHNNMVRVDTFLVVYRNIAAGMPCIYLFTIQCDAIRWEQFEIWHFSRGYNFWTDGLILIMKTPTRPYSRLA